MALNPKLSNEAANAEADAVAALPNNGYLRIYDGSQWRRWRQSAAATSV